MYAVVKTEAELLEFGVIGQPQLVADAVANCLALVVVDHRKEAAQNGGAQEQCRGNEQSGLRLCVGSLRALQHTLSVVDRFA